MGAISIEILFVYEFKLNIVVLESCHVIKSNKLGTISPKLLGRAVSKMVITVR